MQPIQRFPHFTTRLFLTKESFLMEDEAEHSTLGRGLPTFPIVEITSHTIVATPSSSP